MGSSLAALQTSVFSVGVRVGERYGMVHLVKQERWGGGGGAGGTTQSFVGGGMEKEAIF